MLPNVDSILARLIEFQATVRKRIIESRAAAGMHRVDRSTSADTIYGIDTLVEPILEDFCRDWSKTMPLVLIAEGLESGLAPAGTGNRDAASYQLAASPDISQPVEGIRTFPDGVPESDCAIRLIVDPIDGTRGLMYDKRSAWALAGVAPNHGPATRLRDIEAAVMTELPTSKMGWADVLWASRGRGAHAQRIDLGTGSAYALELKPSVATGIDHGFATVSNFFPGTKVLAADLMEQIAAHLIGKADVTRATVFDDQYISTGGQFYELIVGHDRFIADLRPLFYAAQGQPEGLCCHPYDCASMLVALEAGIELTNGLGEPLDGPLDVTTGLSWAGYANATLRAKIEPIVTEFLRRRFT